MLGIILSATTLTNELSKGTIKFLLTRPYNRHKILFSKLSSIAILTTGGMIVSIVLNYILQLILFGKLPSFDFILKQGEISVISVFITTVFFSSFSLLITSLINSSSVSTAITILYYAMAPSLWAIANMFTFKFSTDSLAFKLSPLYANNYLLNLFSASAADFRSDFVITLVANIVYFCIFYLIADFVFYRKDISLSN